MEDMKKTKDELNIAKNDVNNYKQKIQYIKNKSKKNSKVEKDLAK